MAYALSNTTTGFSLSGKLNQLSEAWKAASAKRAVFNKTYNELQALSDRDLADIGITRTDIADLARQEALKAV